MKLKNYFPHNDWLPIVHDQFHSVKWQQLEAKLQNNLDQGKTFLPPHSQIFYCFKTTPFSQVKVVILGQDPYHGPSQAMGLAFSVCPGTKLPPSLRNIYKELYDDLGIDNKQNGDLSSWAKQGVLLLNTVLTVEQAAAASHSKMGWEEFTDQVIKRLSDQKENLIFVLWGAPAQKKEKLIDANKHLILKAAHPSPLSAYRGFFGCHHFSEINQQLERLHLPTIDWKVPPMSC